jgi:hypothetical protein
MSVTWLMAPSAICRWTVWTSCSAFPVRLRGDTLGPVGPASIKCRFWSNWSKRTGRQADQKSSMKAAWSNWFKDNRHPAPAAAAWPGAPAAARKSAHPSTSDGGDAGQKGEIEPLSGPGVLPIRACTRAGRAIVAFRKARSLSALPLLFARRGPPSIAGPRVPVYGAGSGDPARAAGHVAPVLFASAVGNLLPNAESAGARRSIHGNTVADGWGHGGRWLSNLFLQRRQYS